MGFNSAYSVFSLLIRFFGVSFVCGALDMGIGLVCINLFSLHSFWGIAAGFLSGTICGYVFHEKWTFRLIPAKRWRAIGKFFVSNGILLLLRFACFQIFLALPSLFTTNENDVKSIAYIIMLAVSFILNYTICRFLIFTWR